MLVSMNASLNIVKFGRLEIHFEKVKGSPHLFSQKDTGKLAFLPSTLMLLTIITSSLVLLDKGFGWILPLV